VKIIIISILAAAMVGLMVPSAFADEPDRINANLDVNKTEDGIFEFIVSGTAPSYAELTLEWTPEFEILSYTRDGINFTFKGTVDVQNPQRYSAYVCAPELTQALHGGSSELMLCDTPGFHFGQESKAKDWFPDIIFRGAITGGVGNGFSYWNGETIEIAGTIENAIANKPLTITIYNPMQKIAVSKDVTIDSDGKFSTSIIAGGDGFQASGTYSVFFSHSYMRQPSPSQFNFDAARLAPTVIQCQQSESYLNVKNSNVMLPPEYKDITYSLSSLHGAVDELRLGGSPLLADMNNCQEEPKPIVSITSVIVTAQFSSSNIPWKEAPLNIRITSTNTNLAPPGWTYDFNLDIIQNGNSVYNEDVEMTFVCTPGCFPKAVKTTPLNPTLPLDINITSPNKSITLNLHLAAQAVKPQTSEPKIEQKQEVPEDIKEEKVESIKEQKIESKPILSFVDPEKDPSHYVKRYITEPAYKEWFETNFSDMTFADAIGISQQEYRDIVGDLMRPTEPVVMSASPEPEVVQEPKSELLKNDETLKTFAMEAEFEPEPEPTPAPAETTSESKGGGCLIATAAFDSEMAPQVQFLRELRDNTVLQTQAGTSFMTGFNQFYYSFSPQIADYERENPVFKEAVKLTLTPLLTSLAILNYVDIDTEQEMLGYGIGVILLNIGMYFVAPAIVIISLKKRFKF
jgi:hypothetical protein